MHAGCHTGSLLFMSAVRSFTFALTGYATLSPLASIPTVFVLVGLDFGVYGVGLTSPAAPTHSGLGWGGVVLVHHLEHFVEVGLQGVHDGQDGGSAEAVGQQAEVGQMPLDTLFQDRGGPTVAHR